MKKFFAAVVFTICILSVNFCSANFQNKPSLDFDKIFNLKIQPVSVIFSGVVKVQTYLSLREQPNINSREIMRIPNGAEIMFRESRLPSEWLEVISVSFDGTTYSSDTASHVGYVNEKYVLIDYRTGS